MLTNYFINAAFLVSFISIIYIYFIKTEINSNSRRVFKLFLGFIYGVLGIILMIFSVNAGDNVLVDYRYLPLMLSYFSCGLTSGILTFFIIFTGRLLLHGINFVSTVGILGLIIVILICIVVNSLVKSREKLWLVSLGASLLVAEILYFILIEDPNIRLTIIATHSISYILLGVFTYLYTNKLQLLGQSYRKYRSESGHDFLTGLNNVRSFDTLYNNAKNRAVENDLPLCLLAIDIDFFKKVNDTYGHLEGDIVLQVLSSILKKSCRSTDIVSRNGGEEFSVILHDCIPDIGMEIAEKIRRNVASTPIKLSDGKEINITVSVGVACFPDYVREINDIREKADIALYEAKRTGRNKCVLFNYQHQTKMSNTCPPVCN